MSPATQLSTAAIAEIRRRCQEARGAMLAGASGWIADYGRDVQLLLTLCDNRGVFEVSPEESQQ